MNKLLSSLISKQLLLLLVILFSCSIGFAQNYQKITTRIDSLAKKDLPKSALKEVDKLEQLARQNNNAAMLVKAALYRIAFQSATAENAQVTIIQALKSDIEKEKFPVKPVLQSLLATMYQQYYQENRWQFEQRTRLEKPDADFTKWDLQTINDEITRLFKFSLSDYKEEQKTPVGILNGVLEGDKATRYLRPTLYDLLVQRALDFFLAEEPALTRPKMPFTLNDPRLFGTGLEFSGLKIKTTDTASTFYQGIKYLQQATAFHRQKQNEDALADIDLQRLRFLHEHAEVDNKDALYLDALQKITTKFSASPISADALVLQGKYYQDKDSLKKAVTYYGKAVETYPKSLGGKNAAGHIKEINQKSISASVEDVNSPGKPLLALLNYRNIKTTNVTIYKIWATQYNELAKMPSDDGSINDGVIQTSAKVLSYLKKLKALKVEDIQLPDPQDYRSHTTEFKIDPLQTGCYVILLKDAASDDSALIGLTAFKVSQLSFVTRRNPYKQIEIAVMDRETGSPLPGVQVTISETYHYTTDANGICFANLYPSYRNPVKLTTPTDTLYTAGRYINNSYYSPDPYSRTIFFTDRQIYRPGQTVYFKGMRIYVENNKSELLTNKPVTVEIKDSNGKAITSIPFTTNDFGTFSGTFVIPQNILNGNVSITTADGNKEISVEEYKRPTFTVEFSPVKKSYKPGDSVILKGNVTAYSGYGISQAKVAYHITQNLSERWPYRYGRLYDNSTKEIAADTIKTNGQGAFEIKFKALVDKTANSSDLQYQFQVNADVTDGSGETRSANTSLTVADNNLKVNAGIPGTILATDNIKVSAQLTNLDGTPQNGKMQVKIYALNTPERSFKARLWEKPDQYLLTKVQYKKDFPAFAYRNEDNMGTWPIKNTVSDVNVAVNDSIPVAIDIEILKKQPAGTYKIVINARNNDGDTTSLTQYVTVINEPAKPQKMENWAVPINTISGNGKQPVFLLGAGQPCEILMEQYAGAKLLFSHWIKIDDEKQRRFTIPLDTNKSNIVVQFTMVVENRFYNQHFVISRAADDKQLNIRFLTFRNKLQPGEKEQWKLEISGKNKEKQTAEMVADLYDASLDAITPTDNWNNSLGFTGNYEGRYFIWDYGFVGQVMTQPWKFNNYSFDEIVREYEYLGFINANGQVANDLLKSSPGLVVGSNMVFAKAPMAVDMVRFPPPVVKPDMEVMANGVAGAAKTVEEEDTVEFKATAMGVKKVRANGKDFSGYINDFGNQASLTGKPIVPRTNFAETAFFYPQLQTNDKGEILIDFTIPEALTKWRFKGFAHTKDLQTGYVEQEVVTQKELSVTANAPRFLREGDTITISARLANLTASILKGKVQLQLFNALNMQPVNIFVNADDAKQDFDVAATANKAISFKLFIPAGLSALTYRLIAESEKYTDGEENTLPVLPNRMLVTESMPMMVRAGQTKSFNFDKLINQNSTTLKNKSLTLEYTQNPAWYAVQALPYMMEFPYECSEQVFNRYYANSLATNLVNKMPVIKQVFDQWKNSNSPELLSNLEKNQELKETLIEETPWLKDAENETEQKKRIALLFDLNKMSYELQLNLDKLQKKQLPDGGFPWFAGDRSDRYITESILAGIGQLYHLKIVDTQNQELKDIADKAMAYLDNELIDEANRAKKQKNYEKREISSLEIYSYYVQSYFTARAMSADMRSLTADYLRLAEMQWAHAGIYEQALIALTMQRNNKPAVAADIIKSLLETAQQSDDIGMYWAKNQLGYYWYQSPVETQSLMIELFTETGDNDKAIEEMKIWLLRNKQTSNWKTTKATAAACYALLLKGDNWLADQGISDITLGGKDLSVLKPDVKADAGTGYIKTTWADEQVKPELGKVQIANEGKTISWGALHWQYLENLDKIIPSTTDINLERKYFILKQTDVGTSLTAVDATHQPKTGDLLKVVVYLKAGRDFEYVQLKDMRPAGTEPVDVLSEYKYQDGLYYYQVTKDVATNFFISYLNKGNYVFEYQLRVNQPGNFSTGISSVQCMYAPEFNAHSEGARMMVK